MKVMVLSHTGDILGGAEMSMLDVFDVLSAKYNIKPEFILREPVRGLAGEMKRRGWRYSSLPYTFWSDGNPPKKEADILRNVTINIKAIEKISRIIESTKPDIVMTNSIVCPWAALAAHSQGLPHVWFVREYGDLDHGRVFEIGREKTLADVGNLSELVVTISKSLKSHLIKYIPKDKVTVLYNPFKIDEIIKKSKTKVKSPYKYRDSLKLIIAGNMAPSKGQLSAIEAVGRLTKKGYDIELCVVGKNGEPPFMGQVEKVIGEYDISERVHMVGFQSNLLAFVKHADVGVMASRMEGFGRVTFEYLVLGKPVIGAKSGATPEMIDEGKNGFLFQADSVEELVLAIEQYAKKPSLIKIHAKNSVIKAKELMSGPDNIDSLYLKIQKIAAQKEPLPSGPPIYMTEQLSRYQKQIDKLVVIEKDIPLHKKLKNKARQHAKSFYHKARTIKSRVTGK